MSDKHSTGGIQLIAVDMDGTALKSDSNLSAGTLKALKGQIEAGVFVIPASGRIYGGIPGELIKLGVPYVISANGASVMDVRAGTCIYENNMDHTSGISLLKALLNEDGHAYIQYEDQYYGDGQRAEESQQYHPYMENTGFGSEQEIEDLLGFLEKQGGTIQKIGFMAFHKESEKRVLDLGSGLPEFDMTVTGHLMIEFNRRGTTKGEALRWLCARLDVPADRVMAIGDSGNDISMLEFAGMGVAMENAPDHVKSAADYITLSNDDDGVAWAVGNMGKKI